jgi:uncharacterized protein
MESPVLVEHLTFRPAPGLSSPHLQTIFATFIGKGGEEPPSAPFYIPLEDGDHLCCMLSTPSTWDSSKKTIFFIHGLGGSHSSSYMVRMGRKFFQAGCRIVRINLRGIGPGSLLAKRPYHAGLSHDVLQAIRILKTQTPDSPFALIGFSLGGNIALKLAGELGENAHMLLETTIAVCPPIDLAQTQNQLLVRSNVLYHQYYVKWLNLLGRRWIGDRKIRSIRDYDDLVTAPHWGFKDALDYYRQNSSCHFLSRIRHSCHLIFAMDDPFIDYRTAVQHSPLSHSKIWLSKQGGHMGFLGWSGKEHGFFWLDRLLLKMVLTQKNQSSGY